MPDRIAELVAAWRGLWAREELPPATAGPPPAESGPHPRSLLRSLLAGEDLPALPPRPASAVTPSFFRTLCAREQLPPPAGSADIRQPQAPRE